MRLRVIQVKLQRNKDIDTNQEQSASTERVHEKQREAAIKVLERRLTKFKVEFEQVKKIEDDDKSNVEDIGKEIVEINIKIEKMSELITSCYKMLKAQSDQNKKQGYSLNRRSDDTFNKGNEKDEDDESEGFEGSNQANEENKYENLTHSPQRRDSITDDPVIRHESNPNLALGLTNRIVKGYDQYLNDKNQRKKKEVFKGHSKKGFKEIVKEKDKLIQQKQKEKQDSMNSREIETHLLDARNASNQFNEVDNSSPKLNYEQKKSLD